MTIYKSMGGMMVATAMVLSIALVGCSGQQQSQSEPAAQEQTSAGDRATKPEEPTPTKEVTTGEETTEETAPEAAAPSTNQAEITAAEAKAIALTDAGVTEAEITDLTVELDHDDDTGTTTYDVSFNVGTTEYDYDIDPVSGAILRAESGADD